MHIMVMSRAVMIVVLAGLVLPANALDGAPKTSGGKMAHYTD